MASKWLIAVDLDHTALQDLYSLNEYTEKILKKAAGLGHKVMIATARPACLTLPHYRRLNLDTLVALCNGAHFMNIADPGFEVQKEYVAASDLKRVLSILTQVHVHDFGIENNDQLYLKGNMEGSPYFQELIKESDVTPVDLNNIPCIDAGRIFARFQNGPGTDIVIEELKKIKSLDLYYRKPQSHDGRVFISLKSVLADKWYCVKKAADYYRIPEEKIIAFGDEHNDYMMLKEAGIGFVMLNGNKELKQEIGNITQYSNVDGGVGRELAGILDISTYEL